MERRSYGMLVLAALVALGAVGIALFTTHVNGKGETPAGDIVVAETAPTTSLTDTDGDGVPDWKELLWRTDPNNPDTDGDGVSDGDEIAAGVNPLKEGSEPVANQAYVAPKGLPSTDAIARELFAGYAYAKQDGTLDQSEVNSTVSTVLAQNTFNDTAVTPTYSITQVHISEDTEKARISYRAQVDALYLRFYEIPENELSTLKKLLDTNDDTYLDTLRSDAAVYKSVAEDLMKLSVPSSYATAHLALANAMSLTGTAVTGLADSANDPYQLLNAVQYTLKVSDMLSAAYKNFYETTDKDAQ